MFIGFDVNRAGLAVGSLLLLGLAACSQDPAPQGSASGTTSAPAPAAPPAPVFQRASVPPSPPASDLLGRGEYLVESIVGCGNCHSSRTDAGELIPGMEYAGNFVIEEPGFTAYAPNVSPHAETGIGNWTDQEIERAIREGISRDGRVMGPPMAFPFYRDISSNDMAAMIAYLRSVPAVENVVPDSTYNIPLPPSWGPPVELPVADIPRSDTLAYGRYLTHTLGHCTDCHTPLVMGAHDFSRIGAGMNIFPAPFGYTWSALAANITSHETLGLGAWTDDEIKRAIVQGISRTGRELLPFMGFDYYAKISDEDLDLIVAYVRTLPPAEAAPPAEEH